MKNNQTLVNKIDVIDTQISRMIALLDNIMDNNDGSVSWFDDVHNIVMDIDKLRNKRMLLIQQLQ